jgi:hypothetical protein
LRTLIPVIFLGESFRLLTADASLYLSEQNATQTKLWIRDTVPHTFKNLGNDAGWEDSIPSARWQTGVRKYPPFAKYTNGKAADGTNGVSYTGHTMRAFLLISDQQDRSSLHLYKGLATVLDARVARVRPDITNLRVWVNRTGFPRYFLSGNVAIRSDLLETASSSGIYQTQEYSDFSFELSEAIVETNRSGYIHDPSDWPLSICKLYKAGGMLVPEF